MLVQEKYSKVKTFARKGVLPSLSVPTGATVGKKKYDLEINGKSKTLKIGEGKGAFVISDIIGISETTEMVLFYMNDVMVLEVVKGYVYVPNDKGEIFVINTKNKITKIEDDVKKAKIAWKSISDMRIYCSNYVQCKFNLKDKLEIDEYMSNLMFLIKMSYSAKDNCLFSVSFLEMFYGLGVGKFSFEIKEKEVKVISEPSEVHKDGEIKGMKPESDSDFEFESKYDDSGEYIEEKTKEKFIPYDIDDDYYYSDEDDVLPSSMHEVDIFNEYSLDDE